MKRFGNLIFFVIKFLSPYGEASATQDKLYAQRPLLEDVSSSIPRAVGRDAIAVPAGSATRRNFLVNLSHSLSPARGGRNSFWKKVR